MSVGGRLVERSQRARNIPVPVGAVAGNGAAVAVEESTPPKVVKLTITPPNMRTVQVRIVGTAPYLQCAFPEKAKQKIMDKQSKGDAATVGKRAQRPPRDYDSDYRGSMHRFPDGSCGIPANAFRAAAISACRLVGFKMTLAKLAIFVEADGFDAVDSTPLVKIEGKPERHEMMGRNADGTPDVRVRAIYKTWSASVRVTFDADQFQLVDVVNLFMRIGAQVGIGEGRPDSKNSAGMGFGLFSVQE